MTSKAQTNKAQRPHSKYLTISYGSSEL